MTKLILEIWTRPAEENPVFKTYTEELFFMIQKKKSPIRKIKQGITDSQYKGWFLLACTTDETKLNSE